MRSLRNVIETLASGPEESHTENLRRWAGTIPRTTWISQLELRKKGRAGGVIKSIRIDPREGRGSIEARLADGTGDLTVRWLGRSSMPDISLGKGLIVEGAIGRDKKGNLVVLNPEYQLIDGPEHG